MSNNIFGNVIRVQAKTIAQDLVEVVPIGGDPGLFKKMSQDIKIRNRSIRIENILNDYDKPELDITEHEDYKNAIKGGIPPGFLFYMDYEYKDTKKP